MFDLVEKHRGLAQVLLGVVAVTFVAVGGHSVAGLSRPYIGKVGDIAVSSEQVEAVRRNAARANSDVGAEAAYRFLLEQAYLEYGARAAGIGVPSVEQIRKELMADTQFHKDGRFDPALFQDYLKQRGMSESALIEELRVGYLRGIMAAAASGGHIVSDSQLAAWQSLVDARYDVRIAEFAPADFAAGINTDEARLKAYFDAHKARYDLPLAVKLEFVELTADALAGRQTVGEEELAEAYAAMAADEGGEKPELSAVRGRLEAEIRSRKAAQSMAVVREQLSQSAFENGSDMAKVAAEMKLPLQKHEEWLTRQDAEAAGVPAAALEMIFADDTVRGGQNSDVLDMGNGVFRVVRVSDSSPARTQTFEEAASAVRKDYLAAEGLKAAQAAAQAAADSAKTGGLKWSPQETVSSEQLQGVLDEQGFAAVLKARPQEGGSPAYAVVQRPESVWLVEVRAVRVAEAEAEQAAHWRRMLAQRLGDTTYRLYLDGLEQAVPVRRGNQSLDTETH